MEFSKGKKNTIACLSALIVLFMCLSPVNAQAKQEKMLIPMGCTIGIQMFTDGVLVVGLSTIQNGSAPSPGGEAGLMPGDLIKEIGGCKISSANDFKAAAAKLTGDPVSVTAERGGNIINLTIRPNMLSGAPELGLWLRDSIAGIGTVTFYDPDTGMYGGLGHGINDIDSGVIMPLGRGEIYKSTVTDVRKGSPGAPGELSGEFDMKNICGNILKNTEYGIFGTLCTGTPEKTKAIPAAGSEEIQLGKATVLANISGCEIEAFNVEITRIYRGDADSRSIMLCIKDEKLLSRTGGIVQGMSGSPILQNGKIIGAVTHVLVNDPTKGFGVSIDKMLTAAGDMKQSNAA